MYRKKFLPKLLIASLFVGGVNFVPATVNFNAENLQIISVAYAEVKTVTVNGSAGMSFGDNDEKILNMAKNAARMNAIQAAKEQAGIYIKSYVKTINGVLTDDYILAYASNNIKIISESYKKDFYNESDLRGNLTGNVGFKYIATVTVEIDTSDLQNYIRRDEQEKATLAEQAKSSQKNIAEINKNIEALNKTFKNKTSEEIQSEIQKIDNKILRRQRIDEANKLADKGWKLWEKKDYEGAILKYNEAIKLRPNYANFYWKRAVAYECLKNYEQAAIDYTKAKDLREKYLNSLDSKDISSTHIDRLISEYEDRANNYTKSKNYDNAISDYTKILELYQKRLDVLKKELSQISYPIEKKLKEKSEIEYTDRKVAYVYSRRGSVYKELKNYEQAISDYTEAIRLNPKFGFAYVARGQIYKELKNF